MQLPSGEAASSMSWEDGNEEDEPPDQVYVVHPYAEEPYAEVLLRKVARRRSSARRIASCGRGSVTHDALLPADAADVATLAQAKPAHDAMRHWTG